MNTRNLRNTVLVSAALLVAGCGNSPFYHHHVMAGQIVQADDGRTVVCIGEPNGAVVGQVLDAYRVTLKPGVAIKGDRQWSRERVGAVRVDAIIDEHFAAVSVVEGGVMKSDVVTLEP